MRRAWASFVLLVIVGLAPVSPSPSRVVERLDRDHSPVLGDFGASKARARLVAILSPT